ncbi:oxidoreductase [Edaphobacter acidisoli]|uniref:Oxidoreductase n=1 Tax=Edaphobacter acidisoli TaxID=2040573 RepID=A0A916RV91_9BACT|nr:NADH:flavin oxidoreductase/NADH oxidase [Edaphobacter acidisoli]GGA69189.1 oxidoreductase [Edaphobacter acidisoli]
MLTSIQPSVTENASHLFAPLKLRNLTLPNRIAVSPMCEYSSADGFASDWHLVHLGSRAVGGAGLVMTEATAVSPEGRISPGDLGIWKDEHIPAFRRITDFLHQQGAYAGMQLAHAGRKASMAVPWEKTHTVASADGGWQAVAPSAIRFADAYPMPVELDSAGLEKVVADFASAAKRALSAGFDVVEIHAAHGYLLHEFLSPLSNHRTDKYGGSFENRVRFPLEVVRAVRAIWPQHLPVFVRISATDWAPESLGASWTLPESVSFARLLKEAGVDLIDVSTGGNHPAQQIPLGPGYQVTHSETIHHEAGIATGAVGMLTAPAQADQIVRNDQASLVLLAREMLRDPYWPLHAAEQLQQQIAWPVQYLRAARTKPETRRPVSTPTA